MVKKILVVDDEEDVLKMVAFILRKKGYTVLCALNGREGLDLTQKETPDLIILDLLMPVMDGTEVAKRLKSDSKLKNIPIIILTASSDRIDEKVKECKAQGYILKPFDYQELLKKAEEF